MLSLALHLAVATAASSPSAGFPECGNYTDDDGSRLVFVHVYKAAGSTIRNLLREYASACRRSWGCLVDCDKAHLVHNEQVRCELKDVVNSERVSESLNRDVVVQDFYPRVEYVREFDVVGGHLTVGLANIYGSRYNVRYMTMLREPVSSVVSGIRYSHPQYTLDQVVLAVLDLRIDDNSTYKNAVNYLAADGDSFDEASANLRERFDLVGLVENFQTSIELIQLFVDPSFAWKGWFEQPKMNTSPGHFSTREVLSQLPQSTFQSIVDFTRDETRLYATALRAHSETCRRISAIEALPCRCSLDESDRVVTCS